MPKCKSVNKITTAFYSTQESTKCKGRSLTPTFNNSAKAKAVLTAEYESLHYPTSKSLGI